MYAKALFIFLSKPSPVSSCCCFGGKGAGAGTRVSAGSQAPRRGEPVVGRTAGPAAPQGDEPHLILRKILGKCGPVSGEALLKEENNAAVM